MAESNDLTNAAMTPELIGLLAAHEPEKRAQAAHGLYSAGLSRALGSVQEWERDEEMYGLIVRENAENISPARAPAARVTVGIAVLPENFDKIRAAQGSPPLADAPADQDVLEFELEFNDSGISHARLDILTSKAPQGSGAMARFLEKFGEGIQQVEIDVTDVDRATEILRARFSEAPIYPATRQGANGTRVNFFLVKAANDQKVLIELVEQPK